jgi:diacylglycerol diphosphate phosphatase/phosphatidate phosphatase
MAGNANSTTRTWLSWANEISVTVVILLLAFLIDAFAPHPPPLSFTERDPTYSNPYVESTVTTTVLVVISAGIPLVLLVLGSALNYARTRKVPTAAPVWAHVEHCGWVLLALAQALLVTKLVTDCIKLGVGQQRPNFFAYCDYAGYREATASGNFSAYWAATTPGMFGDASRCQGTASQVRDSQLSFISGHSSSAFCGMTFLVLYLRAFVGVPSRYNFSWAAFLTAAPLVLAAYVAATRVRDRYHDRSDVLAGAVLGVVAAHWAWVHYASNRRSHFEVVLAANPATADAAAEGRYLQGGERLRSADLADPMGGAAQLRSPNVYGAAGNSTPSPA